MFFDELRRLNIPTLCSFKLHQSDLVVVVVVLVVVVLVVVVLVVVVVVVVIVVVVVVDFVASFDIFLELKVMFVKIYHSLMYVVPLCF